MFASWDESASDLLDRLIEEQLAAARITTPPVDSYQLADSLGLEIVRDRLQSGRARLARLSGDGLGADQPVVFLNEEPRRERRHWAVAHEIGEYLAPQLFRRLGFDPRADASARERLANVFARRLLLPSSWFAPLGRESQWDLLLLKEHFTTASHEVIAQRMLDLSEPVILTVFDANRVTWRRTNQPRRTPRLSPEEAHCQRVAHAGGEPICHQQSDALIRAWPIHEKDWKREILRTDIPAWF
jgi:Zn-dependent peptidase ImmA (M78 family)